VVSSLSQPGSQDLCKYRIENDPLPPCARLIMITTETIKCVCETVTSPGYSGT
jgi:hypothetical protein